jgi:hypothetical protein
LRYHFQFVNEHKLFSDVHNETLFSVNVYRSVPSSAVGFDTVANLFGAETLARCYEHSGQGEVGGIKDDDNKWNHSAHRDRVVPIEESVLALFARLYDDAGTPALQARLPAIHAVEVLSVLAKFAAHPKRLGDLGDEYYSTEMWHETNAQKDETIRRETRFPEDAGEWILSGPHFYVGKPFHQTPRRICNTNRSYDNLDLTILPDDYLPRTNYVPACDAATYLKRTPRVSWGEASSQCPTANGKPGREPVTNYYRLVFRRQLSQSGERTLVPTVAPPGAAHIHPVNSLTASRDTILAFAPLTMSVVYDFFIKTTGKGDLYESTLRLLPYFESSVSDAGMLGIRALQLLCLTEHYADLWNELVPSLLDSTGEDLPARWSRECALRTDEERRQALVEIDVLAAMALGLSCDELCAIYRIQFPVLRQNENDTWYDANGRIVFTCSKGLPGVGLDRATWEAVSQPTADPNIRDLGSGTKPAKLADNVRVEEGRIVRTVEDDTIRDYRHAHGRFMVPRERLGAGEVAGQEVASGQWRVASVEGGGEKSGGVVAQDDATITIQCPCPDFPVPIAGPVLRDIVYVPPFTRRDREEDYRRVWAAFRSRGLV